MTMLDNCLGCQNALLKILSACTPFWLVRPTRFPKIRYCAEKRAQVLGLDRKK